MPRLGDLALVVTLAAVGAVVCALPLEGVPIRGLLAAPLVFVLPGYALTAALFPRTLDWAEWLLFTLGLALAITALGGLVLNVTPWGLNAQSWATLLFGVTAVASLVAIYRRRRLEDQASEDQARSVQASVGVTSALAMGCAALLAGGAMWLAHTPVPQQPEQGYTLMWSLPVADAGANGIRVGVRNFEPVPTSYALRIVAGGQTIQQFAIDLEPVDGWEADVSLPTADPGPIEALLYRADAPDVVYRRTLVRAGT
jgi:hypothetical protein